MLNSGYPLCVECESCVVHTYFGGPRIGTIDYECTNDQTSIIDVVSGKVKTTSCDKQRKVTGMEVFGIYTNDTCGIEGKFFKKKVLDNQ